MRVMGYPRAAGLSFEEVGATGAET